MRLSRWHTKISRIMKSVGGEESSEEWLWLSRIGHFSGGGGDDERGKAKVKRKSRKDEVFGQ